MNSSLSFAKAWFAVSLLVLAFGYGFASHAWDLFPKAYVELAWGQAQNKLSGSENPYMVDQFYQRSGRGAVSPEEMGPGLTLLSSSWENSAEFRLVDSTGRTVHKWSVDRGALFPEAGKRSGGARSRTVHGSHLLPSGDLVFNVEYSGTARINSCGDVVWKVEEGNHHSVHRSEDGSFWTPGVSSEKRQKSSKYEDGYPGISKEIWIEYLVKIGEDGSIERKINVIDAIYESNLSHIIREGLYNHKGGDLTHMNDIETLNSSISGEYERFDSGDILVSLLGLNMVLIMDNETHNIKWYTKEGFSMQHDPDFIGDGIVSVFDNNTKWNGSRIVFFDTKEKSMEVVISSKDVNGFFTSVQGKHQVLENGNILLTETTRGRVFEVSPSNEIVWEWIKEPTGGQVAKVTEGTRYDFTREEVASWACSSIDSVSTTQKQ